MLPRKNLGLTLIELMIASAIAGIFFTLAFATVSHMALQQTKIERAQRFYNEMRILADRISILTRNQTLDYDRYWAENLSTGCQGALGSFKNFFGHSNEIQYPDSFYINLQSFGEQDGSEILDTLRGGVDGFGNPEPCTQALETTTAQTNLYLINSTRTRRTTLQFDATDNTVLLQREVGADTDGDQVIDVWSDSPLYNNNFCKIEITPGDERIIQGDAVNESFCHSAHAPTPIAPDFLEIQDLSFFLSPDRDPALAYELPDKRIQPHVRLLLKGQMREAESQGFSQDQTPRLQIQTSVASRVYGNSRPPHNIYRYCTTPRCE